MGCKVNVLLAVWTVVSFLTVSCETEKPVTEIVDFENLSLDASGVWNGSDGTGGFRSGNLFFPNNFNPDFQAWSGFAYTNHKDTVTGDYTNQYSSIAGTGAEGSSKYGVFYYMGVPDTIKFAVPGKITGFSVCNSTYAYKAMKYGSPFNKKFGGETGDDPDWFKVTLTGINELGNVTGYVDIYLADFRFPDRKNDYIANVWTSLDLSELGFLKALKIEMSSSDSGEWGINTPAYFCVDNIKSVLSIIPE